LKATNFFIALFVIVPYILSGSGNLKLSKKGYSKYVLNDLQDSITNLNGQIIRLKSSTNSIRDSLKAFKHSNELYRLRLSNKVALLESTNNGRFDTLKFLGPLIAGLLLLIAGFAAFRSTKIAKATAREEIEDVYNQYCKKMESMTNEAESKLAEIKSYHETFVSLDKIEPGEGPFYLINYKPDKPA